MRGISPCDGIVTTLPFCRQAELDPLHVVVAASNFHLIDE
jgi:hypothetical protein